MSRTPVSDPRRYTLADGTPATRREYLDAVAADALGQLKEAAKKAPAKKSAAKKKAAEDE